MDITHRSGQYLHGPEDILHLSFPTGGVPRSFSIVAYSARGQEEIDLSENGIAILDNDLMTVVLDGHLKGDHQSQSTFLDRVREMKWDAFANFCCEHPRFRGSSPDLYMKRPDRGILANQIHLGVMDMPADGGDIRSPHLVRANADPACPYEFPPSSRQAMINEIIGHHATKDANGCWTLSWPIVLPPELRLKGQIPGRKVHDQEWSEHFRKNPEIFHQAQLETVEPYLCGQAGTWPKSDAGRYLFDLLEDADTAVLSLASIDGVSLALEGKGAFGKFLDNLGNAGIRDIWKLVRVMDSDLSPERLKLSFEGFLSDMRSGFERTLDATVDPEPN